MFTLLTLQPRLLGDYDDELKELSPTVAGVFNRRKHG